MKGTSKSYLHIKGAALFFALFLISILSGAGNNNLLKERDFNKYSENPNTQDNQKNIESQNNLDNQNNINNRDKMKQKRLIVKKISFNTELPSMNEIRETMDRASVQYHSIDLVNWPSSFPYAPQVEFRIAYSESEIYLQYNVKESAIRALYDKDEGSRPFEDSCVEFFMIPGADDEIYYNLELNCIGFGTFDGGAGRRDRKRFGQDVMEKIRRESTLSPKQIEASQGEFQWSITIAIPISLYSLSDFPFLSGREVRANFYKCGDKTPTPHYLSWSPVGTERPNFHTPEYFGIIKFE